MATPMTFADQLIERLTDEQYNKVINKLNNMKDQINTFNTPEQLDKLTADIVGDLFGNEKVRFINMDDKAKLEFLFKKMSPKDQKALMRLYVEESNVRTSQKPNQDVPLADGSTNTTDLTATLEVDSNTATGGKRNKSKKPKRRNSRSKRRKTVSKRRR